MIISVNDTGGRHITEMHGERVGTRTDGATLIALVANMLLTPDESGARDSTRIVLSGERVLDEE